MPGVGGGHFAGPGGGYIKFYRGEYVLKYQLLGITVLPSAKPEPASMFPFRVLVASCVFNAWFRRGLGVIATRTSCKPKCRCQCRAHLA